MDYFTCKRCNDDVRGPIPPNRLCEQCLEEARMQVEQAIAKAEGK